MTENNPFKEMWDLGYRRLVPVIPPDAQLSERSSIAARARAGQDPRGKSPGVRREDGTWTGMQFVAMESREEDLDVWHAMGASVGVKTGQGLIAVDIDTKDRHAAERIYKLAAEHLGPASVRFGQRPKCLLLYEAPESTPYRRVSFSTDTEDRAAVEILSEGRQFVARGIHPKTGSEYAWPQGTPRRNALSRITTDDLDSFLHAVAENLPGAKLHDSATERDAPDQESLQAPSWERLKEAVEATPNTTALFPNRDDYVTMAYAIKGAAPDGYEHEARELYLDWCDKWYDPDHPDGTNDPDIALRDWERAKPPFRTGFNYLLKHATGLFFDKVEPDPLDDMFAAHDEATGNTKKSLEILLRKDIESMQPMEYLLERHVPKGGLGFLYGAPGAGKSFLALDMALHLAYGRKDWHGDECRGSQNGWVIYLAREGSAGFKARIHAWEQNAILHDPNPDECRFALIRETLNFMQPEDVHRLIQAVESANLKPIDLIVVDTVSRVIPGADENLQKDMTLFVTACEALQQRFNCAVMGVHHAGKSGQMRGSTVFQGAGDFVLTLQKDDRNPRDVKLHCAKQKDIEDGWTDSYAMETVQLAGDKTSLVPRRKTQEEIEQRETTADEQDRILDAMQAAWDAGAPWTLVARAKDRYAPRQMSAKFGLRAEEADALLDLWTQQGTIETAALPSNKRIMGYRVRRNKPDPGGEDGVFG